MDTHLTNSEATRSGSPSTMLVAFLGMVPAVICFKRSMAFMELSGTGIFFGRGLGSRYPWKVISACLLLS